MFPLQCLFYSKENHNSLTYHFLTPTVCVYKQFLICSSGIVSYHIKPALELSRGAEMPLKWEQSRGVLLPRSTTAGGDTITVLGGVLCVECGLEKQTHSCRYKIWLKCTSDQVKNKTLFDKIWGEHVPLTPCN